ncbi:21687_t:CDS:2, partial [Cetraspora pellucida]
TNPIAIKPFRKTQIADQLDLDNILVAVNQLQLDNQALQQDNMDLRNALNYLHA